MTPHPRIGVAVIVVREGRVLLGQRLGAHGEGTWALPGGHLEFGETIEGCAGRELAEETGLLADAFTPGPFTNNVLASKGLHYVTLFMLARDARGEPARLEPDKCAGWQWFAWSELPLPLFSPLASLQQSGYVPDGVAAAAAPRYPTRSHDMTDHTATLKTIYAAFAAGDIASVLGAMSPDIHWTEAEGGPYGGVSVGPAAVLENVFMKLGGEWDGFSAVPQEFVAQGDTVVALGTYAATFKATGKSFTAPFAHVWKFRDGKAASFHQHTDTAVHRRPMA